MLLKTWLLGPKPCLERLYFPQVLEYAHFPWWRLFRHGVVYSWCSGHQRQHYRWKRAVCHQRILQPQWFVCKQAGEHDCFHLPLGGGKGLCSEWVWMSSRLLFTHIYCQILPFLLRAVVLAPCFLQQPRSPKSMRSRMSPKFHSPKAWLCV